ncbi:MAG: MgtC/SapB family protein [Bacteroidota bacterium]
MTNNIGSFLTPYLLSIIVSTGIGLIIGLEREFRKTAEKDHFAGIRTFPLVCLFGCIATFAAASFSIWIAASALFAFIVFIGATYFVRSAKGHTGMTTEVSLIITFILGMMTAQQLIKESLAVMVITTTLLALKGQFHSFILKITEDELFAFIKFIILCLLLFPFLPDTDYGPNGILNPQEVGFIVVVVSSISFVGYLLTKFTGTNKGILLTALFGGLVSSTAVTWMFSSRSQKSDPSEATLYAAGIILASSIMFLRVAIVAFIFNRDFATTLILPCAMMFVAGLAFCLWFVRKTDTMIKHDTPIELGNPVNIPNALGFGLLYVCIAYVVFYGDKLLGNKGLILSGAISGLADVDAVTITIAKLSQTVIGSETFLTAVLLATVSNTVVKLVITLLRSAPEVKRKVTYAMGAILLVAMTFMAFQYVH